MILSTLQSFQLCQFVHIIFRKYALLNRY